MKKPIDFYRDWNPNAEDFVIFERMVNDLERQYPIWPSTFAWCQREGCKESARGGGLCASCILEAMVDISNSPAECHRVHKAILEKASNIGNIKDRMYEK